MFIHGHSRCQLKSIHLGDSKSVLQFVYYANAFLATSAVISDEINQHCYGVVKRNSLRIMTRWNEGSEGGGDEKKSKPC